MDFSDFFALATLVELLQQTANAALQPEWLQGFFNPRKRLFWAYLLSALCIALLWLVAVHHQKPTSALRAIFQPHNWLNRSALADCTCMFINGVLLKLLSAKLLTKATVATGLFTLLHDAFQGRVLINGLSPWQISVAFTVFLFVVDDFARYWLHRWLHTIPALWAFHHVHHSATSLNPLTIYRTHPVESVLFIIRSALVQGISIGIFIFFLGDGVTLLQVFGANVFSFTFNALGANLRHSPIAIAYWRPVEKIFISPAQHHIHHSIAMEHHDKNFGVALAVWDWMFGTLYHASNEQSLIYGAVQHDTTVKATTNCSQYPQKPHSLKNLYFTPFVVAFVTLYASMLAYTKKTERIVE